MRNLPALAAVLVLAACSGNGGGGVGSPIAPAPAPAVPSSANLVRPTFAFALPAASTDSARRAPAFVSSATRSVTIALTNAPPGLTPTSVTTAVTGACTVANPCVVSGPASPPSVADTYLVQTFASSDGSGAVLDTGSVTITPVPGVANSTTIVLQGVPASIVIGALPAADTAGTTDNKIIPITVKDAAGVTITGTYATPILVTAPDSTASQGTTINGTPPSGGCPTTPTCTVVANDAQGANLIYGGLAENPVTITASATGATTATAVFTPILASIVHIAGPTSAVTGTPFGIDLFTSVATSSVGYSGVESYSEAGYTTAPYNKTLAATPTGTSCAAFATIVTAANATTHATDFTATSIASPVAGLCTLAVGDGLTAHATGGPTFVVDYTTLGTTPSSVSRHQ